MVNVRSNREGDRKLLYVINIRPSREGDREAIINGKCQVK